MGTLHPASDWLGRVARHMYTLFTGQKIEIAIDPQGRLFFEGQAIRLWMLRDRLAQVSAALPGASVRIISGRLVPSWADNDDQNDMLIEVLDVCQALRLFATAVKGVVEAVMVHRQVEEG